MSDDARRLRELEQALAARDAEVAALRDLLLRAHRLAAVGEVTTGMVHELNQPLFVLSGYLELLREGTFTADRGARIWDPMGRAVERARGLVTDLRPYARQQGGAPVPVDLLAIARLGLTLLADGRAATVRVEGAPTWVLGVDLRLAHVVVNLVTNALEAGGEPLAVRVGSDGRDALLEVEDHGPGDPDALRPLLEKPAFGARAPGERVALGLAVASRVARDHGGTLTVGATPGGGLTFLLRLPLQDPPR